MIIKLLLKLGYTQISRCKLQWEKNIKPTGLKLKVDVSWLILFGGKNKFSFFSFIIIHENIVPGEKIPMQKSIQ